MTQSFLANLPWVLLAALGSFAVYKIGDGKAEGIGRQRAHIHRDQRELQAHAKSRGGCR